MKGPQRVTFYVRCLSRFFTKPIICTWKIHKSIVFCHSNTFRHYSAIFRDFLHQILKLVKIWQITFIMFLYTAFCSKVQFSKWPVTHYSNIMCRSTSYCFTVITKQVKNFVKILLSWYVVAVSVCVHRHLSECSIHCGSCPYMNSRVAHYVQGAAVYWICV